MDYRLGDPELPRQLRGIGAGGIADHLDYVDLSPRENHVLAPEIEDVGLGVEDGLGQLYERVYHILRGHLGGVPEDVRRRFESAHVLCALQEQPVALEGGVQLRMRHGQRQSVQVSGQPAEHPVGDPLHGLRLLARYDQASAFIQRGDGLGDELLHGGRDEEQHPRGYDEVVFPSERIHVEIPRHEGYALSAVPSHDVPGDIDHPGLVEYGGLAVMVYLHQLDV